MNYWIRTCLDFAFDLPPAYVAIKLFPLGLPTFINQYNRSKCNADVELGLCVGEKI